MKHIIETYGAFILFSLAAVLGFGLMFHGIRDGDGNTGIFGMAGADVRQYLADSRPGSDFPVYDEESRKPFPEISCTASASCTAGRRTELTELFSSQDWAGQETAFYILSVTDRNGTENALNPDGTSVTFPLPGIYTFLIKTQDAWNRETLRTVRIPVNMERSQT